MCNVNTAVSCSDVVHDHDGDPLCERGYHVRVVEYQHILASNALRSTGSRCKCAHIDNSSITQRVLFGFPGRLLHHLQEVEGFSLRTVYFCVLDEADRLFEMGLGEQVGLLLAKMGERRQTLLFSATLPRSLADFAQVQAPLQFALARFIPTRLHVLPRYCFACRQGLLRSMDNVETYFLHRGSSTCTGRDNSLYSMSLSGQFFDSVVCGQAGLREPVLIRLDADTKLSPDLGLAFFNVRYSTWPKTGHHIHNIAANCYALILSI